MIEEVAQKVRDKNWVGEVVPVDECSVVVGFDEVKVRLIIDGKKYAFRTGVQDFESLFVPKGELIRKVSF